MPDINFTEGKRNNVSLGIKEFLFTIKFKFKVDFFSL